MLECKIAPLHSILVKSIHEKLNYQKMSIRSLHSILVKSILYADFSKTKQGLLYIPFWLNLYFVFRQERISSLLLYIPFWLNLYTRKAIILLIMILLYIPFWLNLYSYNHRTLISAAKTPPFCRPRYYTYLVYQINLINTDPISILTK